MAQRDQIFAKFGPLQIEALVDQIVEDSNVLRQNAGLPAITKEGYLNNLDGKINALPKYDWMVEPEI